MANLNLTDAGIHSSSKSTTKQIVTATPQFNMVSPYEFTMSNQPVSFTNFGGTATTPTMVGTTSGLINIGDILKMTVSGTIKDFQVGGVSSVTNSSVIPTSANWAGSTSYVTITSGSAVWNTSVGYINLTQVFSGNFTITLNIDNLHNGGYTEYLGLTPASGYTPGSSGINNGYHFGGGGTSGANFGAYKNGTATLSYTQYTASKTWQFIRTGTTFTISYDGTVIYTDSSCITGDLLLWFGTNSGHSGSPSISNISYVVGAVGTTYTLSNLKDSTGLAPTAVPTAVYKERTTSNFSVVPAGSYATLSQKSTGVTLSGNNLTMTSTGSHLGAMSSLSMTSGKYYAECTVNSVSGNLMDIGITPSNSDISASGSAGWYGGALAGAGFAADGRTLYNNGSWVDRSAPYVSNNVVGIAFDATTGKVWWSVNGVWVSSGNPSTGANPSYTVPVGSWSFISSCWSTYSVTWNFGASNWAYNCPTGFSGLGVVGSTTSSWLLTNLSSGLLTTGDSIIGDGITQTPSAISSTSISIPSTASLWQTQTGITFTGLNITNNSSPNAVRTASTYTGYIAIEGDMYENGGNECCMGLYPSSGDASWTDTHGAMGTITGSLYWQVLNATTIRVVNGSTLLFTYSSHIDGNKYKVERLDDNTVKFYCNGVLLYTSSINLSGSVRASVGLYSADDFVNNCYLYTAPCSVLTPAMTGYTSGAITVSGSSYDGSSYPWGAFNQAVNYSWFTLSGNKTGWIKIDFGSTTSIGRYTIECVQTARAPSAWTFEGSNTGSFSGEQVVLDTQTGITGWTNIYENRTYNLASTASYRYYRLNVTNNNGDASYLGVSELRIYGPISSTTYTCTMSPSASIPSTVSKILPATGLTANHANSGLISAGDELYFKSFGSNSLTPVQIGGVSAIGGAITCDSSYKASSFTLSNSNLTFVSTTSVYEGVRLTGAITGKIFFCVRVDSGGYVANGYNYTGIGIVKSTWATNFGGSYSTDTNSSFMVWGDAFSFAGGQIDMTSNFGGVIPNDIIMCAADLTAGKIWFGKNGTWYGSPSAGTGAADTFTPSGTYYAMVGGYQAHGTMVYGGYTLSGFTELASSTSYTLSSVTPSSALYSLPEKAYKIRNTKYNFGITGTTYATLDTTVGNYSTNGTMSGSNLIWTVNTTTTYAGSRASIGMTSGKWYAECKLTSMGLGMGCGIVNSAFTISGGQQIGAGNGDSFGFCDNANGKTYHNNVGTSTSLTTNANNDLIMIALDMTTGNLWLGKNGVWASGNPSTNTSPSYTGISGTYYFAACLRTAGENLTWNFGQNTWAYTCPTGFVGLSSGSTATSWQLTNLASGAISNNDNIFADGVVRTVGSVSQSGGPGGGVSSTNPSGIHAGSNVAQYQIAVAKAIPAGTIIASISAKNSVAGTIRGCIFRQDTTTSYYLAAFVTINHSGNSTYISSTLSSPYTIPSDGKNYYVGVYSPDCQMHLGDTTDLVNWGCRASLYSGQSDASVGLQVTTSNDYTSSYTVMVGYTTSSTSNYTYTCTGITPTPSIVPSTVTKITPMTYVAQGLTSETICKDITLNLISGSSTYTNIASQCTPTQSTTYSGYPASNLIDGNINTGAVTVDGQAYAWYAFQFPTAKVITQYGWCSRGVSYDVTDWTFQGSNTGAWSGEQVILDTRTNYPAMGSSQAEQVFPISNTTAYTYYRFYVTKSTAHNVCIQCAEFNLYTSSPITNTTQLVTSQAYSLLPYIGSSALNKSINITVGGVTSTVTPSGTVIENTVQNITDSYSNTTLQDDYYRIFSGVQTQTGQAFTISLTKNLSGCAFYMLKTGSPTGTGYAKLYAASGTVGSSAIPTGVALASCSFDISTIPTSYSFVTFTFTQPYMATAGGYVIVIENINGDASNNIRLGADSSSPTHGGNAVSYSAGIPSSDLFFYLYDISLYNTIIPITTVASAPTAATIKSKYNLPSTINTVSYVNSTPEVQVICNPIAVTNNTSLKKLALRLRGDFGKAKTISVQTTQTGS